MELDEVDVAAFRAEMTESDAPVAEAPAVLTARAEPGLRDRAAETETRRYLVRSAVAMSSGIAGLEAVTASLCCNRAALLRMMERFDDAAAGHRERRGRDRGRLVTDHIRGHHHDYHDRILRR